MANPESKFVVSAEDRATATLRKIAAEFGGLSKASSTADAILGQFGRGFLTTLASSLSVAGLAAAVKSVANLQDEFGKLSQRVGIGVKSLTELDYAAKLSDVSTEELTTGITRLTSKMADVATGSKEAAKVFDALGVKVQKSDGSLRSSEDVLKDVAERFAGMEDGATKTAIAVELFGRSGAKLIPMLNGGRSGLEEMAEEARRLGVVFDEKASKAAEEFNDNLTRLGYAAQGLKLELFSGLVPVLGDVVRGFIDARREGLGFFAALNAATDVPGFSNLQIEIDKARQALAELEKAYQPGGARFYEGSFDAVGKERALAEARRAVEALVNVQVGRFSRDPNIRLPRIDDNPYKYVPPVKYGGDGKGSKSKGKKPRFDQVELTPQQSAVIEAARDYDKASRAAEVFALKLQVLDAKFFDQGGSVEDYTAAVRDLSKATETAGKDGVGDLRKFADGWLDTIDPMREAARQMAIVQKAVAHGFIEPAQAAEIKRRLEEALQPISEADAWAIEAARNIQDHLGQGMFDILDGNFDNIGKSFTTMLKRMTAEAMAANLSRSLFGDFAKSGKVGGWLGDGLALMGRNLGFGAAPISTSVPTTIIPQHATGLDYVPYDGYIAQLHRGERVQTAEQARAADAGSVTVAPQITINGEMSRSQEARLVSIMRNVAISTLHDSRRRSLA